MTELYDKTSHSVNPELSNEPEEVSSYQISMNKHELLDREFSQFIFEKTGGAGKQADVARKAFKVSDPPTIWQRVRKGERKLSLAEASALADVAGKPLSWIIAQVEARVDELIDSFDSQETQKSA